MKEHSLKPRSPIRGGFALMAQRCPHEVEGKQLCMDFSVYLFTFDEMLNRNKAHVGVAETAHMNPHYRRRLAELERQLLAVPVRRMFASATWAADVPLEAGVYVVWDRQPGHPVYVGETVCLQDRMSDVGRSVNHTFRRKAAVLLRTPAGDEAALSIAMSERYDLSFVAVSFGRAELEEYLRVRWRRTIINGPAKRLLRGPQYLWITPSSPTLKRTRPRQKLVK